MRLPFMFCLLLHLVMANAAAQTKAAETSAAGNTYLAGGDLRIVTPVIADLISAGGRISVEREVGADAALTGGSVDVRAPVMQDLRVAAGTVNIQSNIGGDLAAAGGSVKIENTARIAGSAWLSGGEVTVAGRIGKGAKIYGNRINISGEIVGDTRLAGQQIVLAPSARIDGNLSYASPTELPENQRAQISGTITRLETPEGWHADNSGRNALSWFHPIFFLSMLICGMLLYLLFPNAVTGAAYAIRQYPGRTLLAGVALLFTVPPLAILFMVTVVGLPIGFALLFLYPLALLLGYITTAFFVSREIAVALKKYTEPPGWKKQTLFLALSLLVLGIALVIPYLGGLILILAIVAGLGGWAVSVYFKSGRGTRAL